MRAAEHYYGIYRGITLSNADPENLMRLQVKVPQLLGEQATDWAWPCLPVGASATLPDPGDGVWISFEAGDISKPVWVGLWKRKAV